MKNIVTMPRASEDEQQLDLSHCCWECKWRSHSRPQFVSLLKRKICQGAVNWRSLWRTVRRVLKIKRRTSLWLSGPFSEYLPKGSRFLHLATFTCRLSFPSLIACWPLCSPEVMTRFFSFHPRWPLPRSANDLYLISAGAQVKRVTKS